MLVEKNRTWQTSNHNFHSISFYNRNALCSKHFCAVSVQIESFIEEKNRCWFDSIRCLRFILRLSNQGHEFPIAFSDVFTGYSHSHSKRNKRFSFFFTYPIVIIAFQYKCTAVQDLLLSYRPLIRHFFDHSSNGALNFVLFNIVFFSIGIEFS